MRAVSRINDTVSKAVSIANSKKELIFKQFVNIALLFVILLVFGCLDFATLTFHFEYILTASYWATVGSKVIAGMCAFNIGINLMYDAEVKKNAVLAELIEKYDELIKRKQLDFEYYVVHVFNPAEKKKAYISQINRKIYLLNKVSRAKDRLLYSSDLKENQEKKKHNKYCIKRQELEDLKKDDFIEKNLASLKVKYYEVDPVVFDLEIDGAPAQKGVKTKGNAINERAKATTTMVVGMVMFSMFITAFGLEANKQVFEDQMVAFWHYCLKCVQDIGIILWQVSRGALKTRKIISSSLTEPYAGRIKVLTDYLEWRLTNNRPNSLVYDELNSEVEIEMTEEELQKITGGANNGN